jgi:PLP dependent protein
MPVDLAAYHDLKMLCETKNATLVAVSKTKPNEDIMTLYNLGHRDFGENYVQELTGKFEALPKDIRWHFIGHLQSNKVKYIAPFVHLIHGVDSLKLLTEINKQGAKFNRSIACLLQMHIAQEETKFGLDEGELDSVLQSDALKTYNHVKIAGLMGMASFSDDEALVRSEFKSLYTIYQKNQNTIIANSAFKILSMGMSGDYTIALEEGSNMIRIGSILFGARQ